MARRVLAPVKTNLSAPPDSLGFHFTEEGVFSWDGVVTLDAASILGPPPADKDAKDEAKEFLLEVLADGHMSSKQIFDQARQEGISDKTLQRASKELGVHKAQLHVQGKRGADEWYWNLPEE